VFTPAVRVSVFDSYDNIVVSPPTNVSLTVTAGTGTFGAALGGASTVPTVDGVATFGNLTIDRVGEGYTLTASAPGVPTVVSAPFLAIPFRVTFTNSTFTPVTLTVAGTPANSPVPPGGSTTFSWSQGRPSSIRYQAFTSGTNAQGGPLGRTVTWDFTFTPANALTDAVTLVVGPSLFFLRLRNSGISTLGPLYVNYGLTDQTIDNIVVAPNSVLYNIGYYRAFANTTVRAYVYPSGLSYVFWNQGTHFTFAYTDNQSITLANLSASAATSPVDTQAFLATELAVAPTPATPRDHLPVAQYRGRRHAGHVP
jgi:hypothetical protein